MKQVYYYLFGQVIVDIYIEGDFSKVVEYFKEEYDRDIFKYTVGQETPNSLLLAYDGWGRWEEITEDEYNQLKDL